MRVDDHARAPRRVVPRAARRLKNPILRGRPQPSREPSASWRSRSQAHLEMRTRRETRESKKKINAVEDGQGWRETRLTTKEETRDALRRLASCCRPSGSKEFLIAQKVDHVDGTAALPRLHWKIKLQKEPSQNEKVHRVLPEELWSQQRRRYTIAPSDLCVGRTSRRARPRRSAQQLFKICSRAL